MKLKDLAKRVREGDVSEGPLADFVADYAKGTKTLRKKDD